MSTPTAVIIGATSKWQPNGSNTRLAHGQDLPDDDLPVGLRWGVGGAVAQRFAHEGFQTVITSRRSENAEGLKSAIDEAGGTSAIVELDLTSDTSISEAFETVRAQFGDPDVLVYNAWTVGICRRKRSFWNTCRWKSSRQRSISAAEGPSWSRAR